MANKLAVLVGIIALPKSGLLDRLPNNGIRLNIPVWLFSSFLHLFINVKLMTDCWPQM
jgi:hypothetical protein